MVARKLRAVDLFCGAGGSTTGAEASGRVKVVLAVNHWRTAIYTHETNHPETRHICARIDHVDPRNDKTIPEFDLLMASPECTHHSIARGGAPVDDQKRATPWHVVIWAEARRPKWIVVENVREFRDWGPVANGNPIKSRKGETFHAWCQALRSLGYQVEHQLLNAADFGEATKRVRLFVVARLGAGKITWPEPTHAGRWRAAAEIIDWTRPCPSIFGRKRPLADKTLLRIEAGLRKFVGAGAADRFMVRLRGTGTVVGCDQPLDTITAGGTHHGLATPFIHQFHNGADGANRTYDFRDPLPTVDTQPRYAVTVPFQYQLIGNGAGRSRSIDSPLPTQVAARENHGIVVPFQLKAAGRCPGLTKGIDEPTPTIVAAKPNHGVVMPYLFEVNHGGDEARAKSVDDPLGTVTTKRSTEIAAPYLVNMKGKSTACNAGEPLPTMTAHAAHLNVAVPFLTQFNGTGGAESVANPLTTCTTKPRHGLAIATLMQTMQELGVVDIGFRMLDVDELAAAQGFPSGYQLSGTKQDQIRQVGNAVCPGVMKAICSAIAAQHFAV